MTIYLRDDEPITAAYLRQELEELAKRIPADEAGNDYVVNKLVEVQMDLDNLSARVDTLFDTLSSLLIELKKFVAPLDRLE